MRVGVPREIKRDEYRVAMLPVGVEELIRAGHQVLIEAGAGLGSGLPDHDYLQAGAELVADAREIFRRADLIVKVKEPQPSEWPLLRRGQTAVHLLSLRRRSRADRRDARRREPRASPTKRWSDEQGRLPLLTPMSEVAGRMSIQEGAKYLETTRRWGAASCWAACRAWRRRTSRFSAAASSGPTRPRSPPASGPTSAILDINMDRLRYLDDVMPPNVNVLFSDRHTIREQLQRADLVIGAVLIPGAKAPCLVEREDLRLMKPGSVIIDVAIDQGGCVETSRPTTHSDPTFIVDDVVHYCVTNMPGAVGRTSTFALCNVTLPWALQDRQSRGGAGGPAVLPDRLSCQHLSGTGDESSRRRDVWFEARATPLLKGTTDR